MIDHGQIEADILADGQVNRILEIGIDDWGSPGICANLAAEGYEVVRIPQQSRHLSAPMKFIDGLVKAGRIHHCVDPVATWGVSNVQVKPDRNENWFPRRGPRKKKIDPALALINAMARAMVAQPEGSLDEWLKSQPPQPSDNRTSSSAQR
jgi:phage terminase large subunit-like protein